MNNNGLTEKELHQLIQAQAEANWATRQYVKEQELRKEAAEKDKTDEADTLGSVLTMFGRNVEVLTREELIDAVHHLHAYTLRLRSQAAAMRESAYNRERAIKPNQPSSPTVEWQPREKLDRTAPWRHVHWWLAIIYGVAFATIVSAIRGVLHQ